MEADEALAEAVQWLPLVARELTKKRHPRPRGLDPRRVTVGGADQAYYYWEDQGQHWKNTPGAISWVRVCAGDSRPVAGWWLPESCALSGESGTPSRPTAKKGAMREAELEGEVVIAGPASEPSGGSVLP